LSRDDGVVDVDAQGGTVLPDVFGTTAGTSSETLNVGLLLAVGIRE
jgi:hypothetical protein